MPYVGKQPATGEFIKLDSITTSATATYALTRSSGAFFPGSANQLIVSLNGVTQAPQTAYTISGSNIVFASALTSADVIDYILVLGEIGNSVTPTDGSVTTAKLGASSVTNAKIADSTIDISAKTTGVLPSASGGGLVKVAASNTAQTGLTSFELDLPTTSDFVCLKLYLNGCRSEVNSNTFWAVRYRQASNSTYFTSSNYSFIGMVTYNNMGGANGMTTYGNLTNDYGILQHSNYVGKADSLGRDETSWELTIYGNNLSDQYTRNKNLFTMQYSNNGYFYEGSGSVVLLSNEVVDKIRFSNNVDSAFSLRSYGLYKVMA